MKLRFSVPLALGALVLSGAGVVLAQGATSGEAGESALGTDDGGTNGARSGGTGSDETGPKLSPDEMLDDARGTLANIDANAKTTGRMAREARKDKDAVKSLCLDDVLGQVEVARDTAADHVTSMEVAVKSGDIEKVEHDHSVMEALGERNGALAAEAGQCIGEEKGSLGGSKLTVSISPEIPKAETTNGTSLVPPTVPPNTVEVQEPPDDVSPVM